MIILKIGGGASINLKGIVRDLSQINEKIIISHGANALRNQIAGDLNRPLKRVTSVSGYSSVFSDQNTIELQMMTYAGLRNKKLVELLQKEGLNAVGLSGIDGAVIRGKRNPGIRTRENGKLKLLRDLSGKPKSVNHGFLKLLLDNGYLPVLTVPIIDENGNAINSENDDIVALLQQSLEVETVIHLIEAPGLLIDSKKNDYYRRIDKNKLKELENNAGGRYKRKLHSILKLLDNNVHKVIIADGRRDNPVLDALKADGTVIEQYL